MGRLYCEGDSKDWIEVHLDCDHVEVEMCVEGQRGSVILTTRKAESLRQQLRKRIQQLK